jgi:hypothetical protein
MAMLDEWSQTAVRHWVSGTDVKQWRYWINGHKHWFSIGYQEQTWNNGDVQMWNNGNVGWTVINSDSALGIRNIRETMAMLDEQSQTQSTLVVMYNQRYPVKILYIWGSIKLCFKVTLQLYLWDD